MRRHLTVLLAVILAASGCGRFGSGGDGDWTTRTQRRFERLLVEADPYPAVGWPSDRPSPYERALALVALADAHPSGGVPDGDTREFFANYWDRAIGAFREDGLPPIVVTEAAWRALTHDGARPYDGPGDEATIAALARRVLDAPPERFDVFDALTAARLATRLAEVGVSADTRREASAALATIDMERICRAALMPESTASDAAAIAEVAALAAKPCTLPAGVRADINRELRGVAADFDRRAIADAPHLATASDATILARAGLADRVLVERVIDRLVEIADRDGLAPDPANAVTLLDIARQHRRGVTFGPRMLQTLHATVLWEGRLPDEINPDPLAFLAMADIAALLPGGLDRDGLARRVDWDSSAWVGADRLVVAVASDPARLTDADVAVLGGQVPDPTWAMIALDAVGARGGCPDGVRDYVDRTLDLLAAIGPQVLVRDATPLDLRDLAALAATAERCGVQESAAASIRRAVPGRLAAFRDPGGLYGLDPGFPDLEVTAPAVEAQCLLGGEVSVPRGTLRHLAEQRQDPEGGAQAASGEVTLFATLAAAKALAFADHGCPGLGAVGGFSPR